MIAKLTDGIVHHAERNLARPVDADEEGIAAEIMGRLAKDWSLLQKPGAAVPETEGWFPPSRPRRGCEDC